MMPKQHKPQRAVWLACALVLAAPGWALAASGQAVSVHLRDQTDHGKTTSMSIAAAPGAVKAGSVTFTVHNDSHALKHEMLLLLNMPSGGFPYDAKIQRVIESKVKKFVDTDPIAPGGTVVKTVTLAPGHYSIICNQPGHYEMGMHTPFTVTK